MSAVDIDEAVVYEGDAGTELTPDTGSDLSTATELLLTVKRPDGAAALQWVGVQYETTKIRYVTSVGVTPARTTIPCRSSMSR